MGIITGSQGNKLYPRCPPSPNHLNSIRQPHHQSSRCHFHQEIYYGDGGCSTRYLDSDDDDPEVQGHNDSPGTRRYTYEEKDQRDPSDLSSSSPKPSGSSLPTPSSPIMMTVPPLTSSESQVRYPSLEV